MPIRNSRSRTGAKAGLAGMLLLAAVFAIFAASCDRQQVRPPATRPLKVAVVLGAGAARGFAHIGVLKVLETNKVPIDMIVGTSAGSLVGSLYAYSRDAFQLQKTALAIDKNDIVDMAIPDNGFIKGDKLEEFVNRMVRNAPIEKLAVPFYAVATSVPAGQEVVFGKGNTGAAVRASCSIPGVFRPENIGNVMYIDGGVVSPVAVDAARRYGADIVIAVDISADLDTRQPEGTIDTILQAITIMYAKLAAIQLPRADVVIRPKVGYIGSADFDKRNEAILEGEKAAIAALPQINRLLSRVSRPAQ